MTETKDIHFGTLVMLAGLLFVLLGLTLLIARPLDRWFTPFSSIKTSAHPLPPEPRLQVDEAVDLVRMHDVEDVILNNYSWVDPNSGRVHIPIARAMAIVAEKGLPSQKETP